MFPVFCAELKLTEVYFTCILFLSDVSHCFINNEMTLVVLQSYFWIAE